MSFILLLFHSALFYFDVFYFLAPIDEICSTCRLSRPLPASSYFRCWTAIQQYSGVARTSHIKMWLFSRKFLEILRQEDRILSGCSLFTATFAPYLEIRSRSLLGDGYITMHCALIPLHSASFSFRALLFSMTQSIIALS